MQWSKATGFKRHPFNCYLIVAKLLEHILLVYFIVINKLRTYTVENAGLILLWPFFSSLFDNLELLNGDFFKSESDAVHAANILEYLVNGNERSNKSCSYLNKVLCSNPYDQEIQYPLVVSNKEAEECDDLLKAAIRQWDVLKNTSIIGLRASFLKRNGQLRMEDDTLLTVGKLSIDVLLDSLPWNFTMIKLPWMERILCVDWI